jgi:CheY-like chemotaxis protein
MKTLIIDHDDVAAQLLSSRLQAMGHEVFHETDKQAAIALIARQRVDLVLLDPAPLTSSRPIVLNMRRAISHYPFVLLLARDVSRDQAIQSGTNDVLEKPIDPEALKTKTGNAKRLLSLMQTLGDDTNDFPSVGGVISKSAFNQLFLSALDRSDRYAERSFMLFFALSAPPVLRASSRGAVEENIDDASALALARHLVHLRRQSDIIGRIEKGRYALLLQRPAFETEPQDAAARFTEALSNVDDLRGSDGAALAVEVSLVEIPTGALLASYKIPQSA